MQMYGHSRGDMGLVQSRVTWRAVTEKLKTLDFYLIFDVPMTLFANGHRMVDGGGSRLFSYRIL